MSYIDYLFGYMSNQLSQRLTTNTYNILRPNYATTDNAGSTVKSHIKMSVSIGAGALLQPPIPGLAGYSVFPKVKGDVHAGDILVPSTPDGQTPALTVAHNFKIEEVVAFRTGRIGTLVNTTAINLYQHVYFDWYRPAGVDGSIVSGLVTSPEEEQRHAVIYYRTGLRSGQRLIDDEGQRWIIISVQGTGQLMTMLLGRDVR